MVAFSSEKIFAFRLIDFYSFNILSIKFIEMMLAIMHHIKIDSLVVF